MQNKNNLKMKKIYIYKTMRTLSLKDKFSFGVILVELPFLIHN